jgi:hypothetical protein
MPKKAKEELERLPDDPQMRFVDAQPEWWEDLWKGMPEFRQNDCEPYRSILVHFNDERDMKAFSDLVGQKLTTDTKYLWFPRQAVDSIVTKRWIDSGSEKGGMIQEPPPFQSEPEDEVLF